MGGVAGEPLLGWCGCSQAPPAMRRAFTEALVQRLAQAPVGAPLVVWSVFTARLRQEAEALLLDCLAAGRRPIVLCCCDTMYAGGPTPPTAALEAALRRALGPACAAHVTLSWFGSMAALAQRAPKFDAFVLVDPSDAVQRRVRVRDASAANVVRLPADAGRAQSELLLLDGQLWRANTTAGRSARPPRPVAAADLARGPRHTVRAFRPALLARPGAVGYRDTYIELLGLLRTGAAGPGATAHLLDARRALHCPASQAHAALGMAYLQLHRASFQSPAPGGGAGAGRRNAA